MESLLDAADALVAAAAAVGDHKPARPNLNLLEDEFSVIQPRDWMELLHDGWDGKGWFATKNIPAGTLLMVSKPIAMVMEWQDEGNEDDEEQYALLEQEEEEDEENAMQEEEKEPRLNELLLLEVLKRLKDEPSLWETTLSTLFPRTEQDLSTLPAWVCHDDDVFFLVESCLQALQQEEILKNKIKDISKRLPLVIRYNVLSVETCPELLSYPSSTGHASLAGVALYHEPSFFNHSSKPNCSRYAIGDIMFFVANQDIPAKTQVCISYIEHDVLCESAHRRNQLLNMNFQDLGENESLLLEDQQQQQEEGPDVPVVDSHVQNELMAMNPLERLEALDELMQQAAGDKLPQQQEQHDDNIDDEDAMEAGGAAWFQCDLQNLRILKAITLDGMGQTQEALKLWEESVAFVERNLPPADESLVVLHVQAALCAYHHGGDDESHRAKQHAAAALKIHALLFGGGVARFRRRFRNDLELKLRPDSNAAGDTDMMSPVVTLWPVE